MVAASKLAEGTPERSVASPSRYSTFGAGLPFAAPSISAEKSMPRTEPPGPTPVGRFVAGAVRGRLANAVTQPPHGTAHPLLRALRALARDHVEQLGEVGRPGPGRDGIARGDAARAVPDHARRHRHEARLVELGAGLAGG